MRIGLIVPEVRLKGGIVKHAEFVLGILQSIEGVEIHLASLAMSAHDPCSIQILDPRTWLSGVRRERVSLGTQTGTHFGCVMSEIETQRFRKRGALSDFVRNLDLCAVVAGAPSWALPVTGLGVPVVLTFATLTALERAVARERRWRPIDLYRNKMTEIVSSLDDRGIRESNWVVVENRIMYDYAVSIKDPSSVIYAPPGVDVEHFKPNRHRNFDKPYLLFVGRAQDPRKNLPMLIAAYRDLISRMPGAPRLVIAGTESPNPSSLAELPEESVEVILNPSDTELASLYRGATASVLTSDEEGFGFVVIEAMASGIPVVATRCGGPQEIIVSGVDGILVDCGNVAQLSESLEYLISNPAKNLEMGKLARAKVENEYSLEVTARRHRSLYERILSSRFGRDSACL